MVKREYDHGGLASRDAQSLLPTIRLNNWRRFMVRQQASQTIARAERIAGDNGLCFGLVERFQMRCDRFVDIHFLCALRCKVARRANTEIDDAAGVWLCKRCYEMRGVAGEQLIQFIAAQIEHFRRQWTIASGLCCLRLYPVFVIVRDRVEARLPCGNSTTVADDERVRTDMIE